MKQILLIPNLLTISRILLIIPSIYFLEQLKFKIAIVLITVLLLTDFFDGFLARKLNQTSYLGAILDPVADKLVVIAFFTHLILANSTSPLYYALVLTRDVLQLSAIPILLFWKKIQFKVKPKLIGKLGTVLNFIILGLYELNFIIAKTPELLGRYYSKTELLNQFVLFPLFLISVIIELYILVTFVPRFIQIFKGKHDTFE